MRSLGFGADGVEAFEGKFFEEAEAGVDGGAAPGFEGTVADAVEGFEDGEHLLRFHSGGGEGLVTVAQEGVVEDDVVHGRGI